MEYKEYIYKMLVEESAKIIPRLNKDELLELSRLLTKFVYRIDNNLEEGLDERIKSV